MSKQSEALQRLLQAFSDIWPESEWGPAHILISDYNIDSEWIELCRARTMERLEEQSDPSRVPEWKATLCLLDMLALMPEEYWDIYGEDETHLE